MVAGRVACYEDVMGQSCVICCAMCSIVGKLGRFDVAGEVWGHRTPSGFLVVRAR